MCALWDPATSWKDLAAPAMAAHENELRALAGQMLEEQLPKRRYDRAFRGAGGP